MARCERSEQIGGAAGRAEPACRIHRHFRGLGGFVARAAVACGVAGAVASGCAPVRPWERGLLAHRCMSPDARPEETKARLHMLGAREASRGAAGETGGGCGCK